MRWALVLAAAIIPSIALGEGSSSGHGKGGWFADFDPIVRQYNASGDRFRIQGHCQSACTLFLSIRNVCVERDARLLFHAGHDRQRNIAEKPTQRMLAAYKPALRQYLVSNGYMKTLAFHTISGADIISKFGYRECPK